MVERDQLLSDYHWKGIKNFLNTEKKRKIDLREVDAIRYIVRGGFSGEQYQPVITKCLLLFHFQQMGSRWNDDEDQQLG